MNRRLLLTGVTDMNDLSHGLKYSQVILFDDRVDELFGSVEAFIADAERRFKRSCEPDNVDVYLIQEERLDEWNRWIYVKDHRNEW